MTLQTLPQDLAPVRRTTASSLLGTGGAVSASLRDAEVRPAQLAMADAVELALRTKGARLLVEAPTGTGKSLAYLAAAGLAASGINPLRVVVATGTKALQDQLALQDAPLLQHAFKKAGLPPPVVEVVKGRRNYLCLHRLSRWQPGLALDARVTRHIQSIRSWADQTAVGDRSELADFPEDSPLWGELDADADVCLGSACAQYDRCFVTMLRARARGAHIIITNHHLLCTDLRLRFTGGGAADARVLPPYDALILDEAHKLPGVAAEYFGMAVTPARVDALQRDAARLALSGGASRALKSAVEGLAVDGAGLFAVVGQALLNTPEASRVPFRIPEVPHVAEAAVRALQSVQNLAAQVEAYSATHREQLAEAESVARRLEALDAELSHLTEARDDRFAYCAERRGTRARLMAYPSDVAAVLQSTLLTDPAPIICTSATLAVGGDFTSFKTDMGIPEDDANIQTMALPSTFSADQAVLYVPKDLSDPDAPIFQEQAFERAVDLIGVTGGGAFLLCTTNRAMNEQARRLREALPHMLVLKQGEAPKAELVNRFKRDGHAVLVATHSFWEGVDVRGQALRLVMVDKMPFAPPHDPLVAARIERAERVGRNSFSDVQLADAVLLLRQGLGRLLRSRQDRGVLCILDGRLWRRGYGPKVLKALGDHPVVWKWEELLAHASRLDVTG